MKSRPPGTGRLQRHVVPLLCCIGLASIASSPAAAGMTVGVATFTCAATIPDCQIGREVSDNLTTLVASKPGIKVVERSRIDSVMDELNLAQSGLVNNSQGLLSFGNMTGATNIIVGEVKDITVRTTTANMYGVSTKRQTYTAIISYRLLDTSTAEVLAGDIVHVKYQPPLMGADSLMTTSEIALNASREISNGIGERVKSLILEQAPVQAPAPAALVTVTFSGSPSGSAVIVDGVMVGSVPCDISMAGGQHTVSVESPGYVSWQQRVLFSEGSKFVANLVAVQQPDVHLRIDRNSRANTP